MKILITGGCGFLGSNLAKSGLGMGKQVLILDDLSRVGAKENLHWLKSEHSFDFLQYDIRRYDQVEVAISDFKPDTIFHLAGQVAMTTSLENPRFDFEVNALGTLNILEAARRFCPDAAILYSSTNKVYGDLHHLSYDELDTRYSCKEYPLGFDERLGLEFCSPYGCSKGAADQYLLDYSRCYGLNTVVFRHSSMYGGRQFATIDQGWIGWFCEQALRQKESPLAPPFSISGTGKQVRDVLHARDMVSLYYRAVECIDSAGGEVFNIGGGFDNSLSLLELFTLLEEKLDLDLRFYKKDFRQSDQLVFIADITKAKLKLGWVPEVSVSEGLDMMLDWTKRTLKTES